MRKIITNNAIICFSETRDGDLSFYKFTDDKASEVWNNLSVVESFSLPEPCWVNQIHSSDILKADGKNSHLLGNADGIITNVENVPIGVFTADCTPIIIFGDNFAAAVHSGWKGCKQNIAKEAVLKLQSEYNALPQNMNVVIGPCINKCCLELGDEVYEDFINTDKNYEQFFQKISKSYLNMRALIRYQLVSAGVNDSSIMDIDLCTFCSDNDFYSYRRQKQRNGSMFSFVMLKSPKL